MTIYQSESSTFSSRSPKIKIKSEPDMDIQKPEMTNSSTELNNTKKFRGEVSDLKTERSESITNNPDVIKREPDQKQPKMKSCLKCVLNYTKRSGEGTDFTLICSKLKFSCHSNVLASGSGTFCLIKYSGDQKFWTSLLFE